MKISLNALKQIYQQAGTTDFLPEDINEISQKIGAQLGEIEETIDLGQKYKDAVVVKVVSCVPHPDADRLKLCTIDDGSNSTDVKRDQDGLIQVVCGAPNVQTGMLAVWLPPGATVPSTLNKEPLVLEAREIRGQVSNGMLASAHELDINDDHDGILAVDKDAKPGDSFAGLYKLDDFILEIENKMFTHRPDCFGLLGIARELTGIYQKPFTSPNWYEPNPKFEDAADELKLDVINEIPELVPRFCAITLSGVTVGPSPIWLQIALSKAGIKAINNVVDLTNFYMWLSGQPLHAYDYDKVAKLSGAGAIIKIRQSGPSEKIKLLNGKEITPAKNTIMIATDTQPIGIGGVIGGTETEVDASTKNIILECANFDAYSIRRTSMHHGLFTEAVTRFTKGQSPYQNTAVLFKITTDLARLTGGKVAGKPIDVKGKLTGNKVIDITTDFINDRLGLALDAAKISTILENVEFDVQKTGQSLKITAPFWRTDIHIPEDIVEEVGRLYGYDHLPLKLPKKTAAPSIVSDELKLKQELRESLAAMGANETLNYSFVNGNLLDGVRQDESRSFRIKNALSPDLQYYRQALTPSLLEKVHPNIKAGFDEFAIFELGKVHIKGKEEDGLPKEFSRLGLVVASKRKKSPPAYYVARKYLLDLLVKTGIAEADIDFTAIADGEDDPAAVFYDKGRSANVMIGEEIIGRIGEYADAVITKLKLPEACAGFEIGLAGLGNLQAAAYKPLSRYPATEQDICLKTDSSVSHSNINASLRKALENNVPDDVNCTFDCIDIFSSDSKSKQTTFRVSASSYERTLTSEIINLLFEKAADDLKKSINAVVV